MGHNNALSYLNLAGGTVTGATTFTNSNVTIGTAASTNGLVLNNSTGSYTPATLNYYEVFSSSGSTSGCITATMNYTYTRIGNIVVFKITQGVSNGAAANAVLTLPSIPTRFTPNVGLSLPYFFKDNGAWVTGVLQVNNNSFLFALLNPDGAPPAGGNCNFPECSFTWSIT